MIESEAKTNCKPGSNIHDLEEDCLWNHTDTASVAIDYLPNFAFYMCNKVVELEPPQITTIDLKEAFEQRLIEPTTFDEAFHHPDPEQRAKWHEAIHKKNLETCTTEVHGTKSSTPPYPKADDVSSQNGYSRSRMMVFSMPIW